MALALKSHPEDRYDRFSPSVAAKPYAKITPIAKRSRLPIAAVFSEAPTAILRDAQEQKIVPPKKPQPGERVVRFQSSAQLAPAWLQWLVALQRGSSAIGFCLVCATLVVYGNTVYSQQKWDSATQQLDNLHRDERQLDLMTEALKHQIAEQTEQSGTGLIPQQPSNFLLLPSMSARPAPPSGVSRPPYDALPKGY
ncbi:MAG: hypothetical protein WBB29_15795 [Geitlerinemataceae cyanobacterium]